MKPVVIVGAVAAGMSAASALKRLMPETEVMVFGREEYISYGACGMPFYVSGEIKDVNRLIVLKPEKAREERGIDLKTAHEVLKIDRASHCVEVKNLKTGEVFTQEYERLVMATGARAMMPALENSSLEGIFPLKELADSIKINRYIEEKKPQKAVVIGGGFIGVEVVESFRKRGMDVTLVEAASGVLSVMDTQMAQRVAEEIQRNHVELYVNEKVTGFIGKDQVSGVKLESGKTLPADLVLMSIGVAPNTEIAAEAGLELGARKAVKIDEYLKTSDPFIYAAGDCAVVYHQLLGDYQYVPLALGANRQGRMAGENIAAELMGQELKKFPGILGTAMTKVFDFEVGKTGIGAQEKERYKLENIESVEIKYVAKAGYYPERSKIWVKLYFEADTEILVGGQIVGQNGSVLRLDILVTAIHARMRLSDIYNMDLGYCPPFSPVWDPILVAAKAGMKKG